MPAANDIRRGQVIKFNGEPHLVMETQHRTPGNLRAFVQIKMRNLRYGKALDQRFASTDTIEVLPTERKTLEFSYADRDTFAFMDPDTFEQIELSAQTQLGDVKHYLTAGGKVDVLFVDERPLSVDLPSTVTLKVIESADGVKGDTASNVQKPAKLETGLVVQVPLFIKEGEIIKVSTIDGSYLGRAPRRISSAAMTAPSSFSCFTSISPAAFDTQRTYANGRGSPFQEILICTAPSGPVLVGAATTPVLL
jgi:elongation factor P